MKCAWRGFTLIELLVFIAVVAILAALLFPVFAQVRAKARQTTCLSNLRQLGTSISLYADDYDEYYPYAGDPLDVKSDFWKSGGAQAWAAAKALPLLADVLNPYVKNREVWQCPADTGFDSMDWVAYFPLRARPTSYQAFGMSYYYHSEVGLTGRTLSGLVAYDASAPYAQHGPAEISILWDGSGAWHGRGTGPGEGRYDVLMGDGHAKSATEDVFMQDWNYDLDPPDGTKQR